MNAARECCSFGSKVSDVNFEEFNGFPGKNSFNASPKLAKRIGAQLVKPFMFEYAGGHVSGIRASAEITDTVVNIVRGILGFFHVTVKTTQKIYQLEEVWNQVTSDQENWIVAFHSQ